MLYYPPTIPPPPTARLFSSFLAALDLFLKFILKKYFSCLSFLAVRGLHCFVLAGFL